MSLDRDCFKLHYNSPKKAVVTVTSTPTADNDVLVFER